MGITIETRMNDGERRHAELLRNAGCKKDLPLCLHRPARAFQTLDMPGVLDWADADIQKVWLDGNVIMAVDTDGAEFPLVDSYEDYGMGNYADAWWDVGAVLESVSTSLHRRG